MFCVQKITVGFAVVCMQRWNHVLRKLICDNFVCSIPMILDYTTAHLEVY